MPVQDLSLKTSILLLLPSGTAGNEWRMWSAVFDLPRECDRPGMDNVPVMLRADPDCRSGETSKSGLANSNSCRRDNEPGGVMPRLETIAGEEVGVEYRPAESVESKGR